MSRIKSHYTAAEQELNLYTFGKEFMTEDRKEYRGVYHRYLLTNEVYTKSTYTNDSKKLITFREEPAEVTAYKLLRPKIKTDYKTPIPISLKITNEDIKAGSVTRNFMKKINSSNIIEVDSDQLKDLASEKIDPNLYQSISINWVITGELNDRMERGAKIIGARSKNEKAVKDATKRFSGLDKKLINPTEYFIDTDFIILQDINNTNSSTTSTNTTPTSSY